MKIAEKAFIKGIESFFIEKIWSDLICAIIITEISGGKIMKFALFLDRYYEKIMAFFLILAVPVAALAAYLYVHLPVRIPAQFGFNLGVTSWGNKIMIFMLPLALALLSVAFSKKVILARNQAFWLRFWLQVLFILVMLLLTVVTLGAYWYYFKMI